MKTPARHLVAAYLFVFIASLLMSGCAVGRIKLGKASVTGVPDPGTPATLTSGEMRSGFRVPAKSKLTRTRTAATATAPAVETDTWDFSEPTEFEQWSSSQAASTGTIDTTVTKHRIDAAERRWLLWAAILGGFAGMILRSLMPAWKGLSNGFLLGAAVAFVSWKVSEIPPWLWGVSIVVAVLLALGYKRAEWDANGNLVPDFLEKK